MKGTRSGTGEKKMSRQIDTIQPLTAFPACLFSTCCFSSDSCRWAEQERRNQHATHKYMEKDPPKERSKKQHHTLTLTVSIKV